jgi:putative nucleotide binding protein
MPDSSADGEVFAVVLDVLPHGRSDADSRQYRQNPVAFAMNEADFTLYEMTLDEGADISILDYVRIEPDFEDGIHRGHQIEYDDLSDGARSELEYVIDDLVDANEDRFVGFYNDAQPVTLRMHQLDLLPGIGDKLRDNIIDERKRRGPFDSFEDLEDRVDGLHNPQEKILERIKREVRGDDLKYRLFAHS